MVSPKNIRKGASLLYRHLTIFGRRKLLVSKTKQKH